MSLNASLSSEVGKEIVDVIVIGAGPGGYVAAIRAAQLGAKVTLIEQSKLGGTCLNRGCIPTKALLKSTGYINIPEKARKMGIELNFSGLNLEKIRECKDKAVAQLVGGVQYLVKKNGIELIEGKGFFLDKDTVGIESGGETLIRKAKKIIIATGSQPASLKITGADNSAVINSNEALKVSGVPSNLLIIGGGAIGVEFAYMYRNLGSNVTVLEMMPRLLPQTDHEIAALLEKSMKKQGIAVYTEARVEKIEENAGEVRVHVQLPQESRTFNAEQVLTATGRLPNTNGLAIEKAGIKTERGKIPVNERMETNVQGIYAIGDVTGGILLAHKAYAEGVIAAENALGGSSVMDYRVIPSFVCSEPETASVGLTEMQAEEMGYTVKTGKFSFAANGKAIATGAGDGLVKVIADEECGDILGVHIIGERASDLIAEAALAMKLEASPEEIINTIHAHPTLAETLMEAAQGVYGRSIHS